MSERLTASPSGRCVTEGPMLVAPREVLVCCVLPWSFPARVSCPMLRFGTPLSAQGAGTPLCWACVRGRGDLTRRLRDAGP